MTRSTAKLVQKVPVPVLYKNSAFSPGRWLQGLAQEEVLGTPPPCWPLEQPLSLGWASPRVSQAGTTSLVRSSGAGSVSRLLTLALIQA